MTLIADQTALDAFCAEVEEDGYITVDTEFMRTSTYWARLCLIQIGGRERAAAIDALAPGIDLAPVWALLARPDLPKVMHASRQDIEIFHHQGGVIPEPLLDTQVAAMVCGFGEQVAYDTLVKHFTGRVIDKKARFADWARRPLGERQIDYALADVVHLRDVYEGLARMLRKNGRAAWVEEEEAVLLDPATYSNEPGEAWRRLKSRSVEPGFLSVLREVAAWREREAQQRDVPRNRILRDDVLLDVAAQAPDDVEALASCRGVTRGHAEGRAGAGLLEAVARGKAVPEAERPTRKREPRRPPGLGPKVELLRVLLKERCDAAGVAQKLVATSDALEAFAAGQEGLALARGWRNELFGVDAGRLLRGELALSLRDGRVSVVEIP